MPIHSFAWGVLFIVENDPCPTYWNFSPSNAARIAELIREKKESSLEKRGVDHIYDPKSVPYLESGLVSPTLLSL